MLLGECVLRIQVRDRVVGCRLCNQVPVVLLVVMMVMLAVGFVWGLDVVLGLLVCVLFVHIHSHTHSTTPNQPTHPHHNLLIPPSPSPYRCRFKKHGFHNSLTEPLPHHGDR